MSPNLKLSKTSSMEIVSALIEINVGVAKGRTAVGVGDVCVAVGGREVCVGGCTATVGKAFTEKLHASSTNAPNRKISMDKIPLRCFIARSLSAVAHWYFQWETII
jgi:hypothetical protein